MDEAEKMAGDLERYAATMSAVNSFQHALQLTNSAALIRRLAAENAAQAERIKRLEEALVSIAEYWNGSDTYGAMIDALDVMIARAAAAVEAK